MPHTEFFGPDLGRGPFAAHRIETAAVQIATLLAQLRAPLSRADADIESHADFIRALADRLAPDWAAQIVSDVGGESGNEIATTIRVALGTFSLLDVWLADSVGGGETSLAPDDVTFSGATILQTVTTRKRFLLVVPATGVATATVSYAGDRTWFWAISRHARIYYSSALNFD